ncbi:hypothetical protein Pcinc_024960 [Petrolisthes cinctipes]|uniref:Uncharacterized protein n=1 Tax=Petrolisthes cinctipes TaxID=88211 RepID=A0AAE1FAY6_PETCI|nr:hypothetical protein Pcinc_024960 [Petrolisthes cinctipes]
MHLFITGQLVHAKSGTLYSRLHCREGHCSVVNTPSPRLEPQSSHGLDVSQDSPSQETVVATVDINQSDNTPLVDSDDDDDISALLSNTLVCDSLSISASPASPAPPATSGAASPAPTTSSGAASPAPTTSSGAASPAPPASSRSSSVAQSSSECSPAYIHS